jgi:hypothetical protein
MLPPQPLRTAAIIPIVSVIANRVRTGRRVGGSKRPDATHL